MKRGKGGFFEFWQNRVWIREKETPVYTKKKRKSKRVTPVFWVCMGSVGPFVAALY